MGTIKIIHLENAVLFNKCVQESGGVMDVLSSYVDNEGDVFLKVRPSVLLKPELAKEYEEERVRKE